MNTESLLTLTATHVRKLFTESDKMLPYHNVDHTEQVVGSAEKIARHYHLNEEDFFVVMVAAWFHDVGYLFAEKKGHEEKAATLAEAFLREQQVDQEIIQKVKECILATEIPQQPKNMLEEIICDADLFDLGTDKFEENNKKVRKEIELTLGKELTGESWRASSIELLKLQRYKTDYCHELLAPGLEKNIKLLEEKQEKKDKDGKIDKYNRGVETMFRTTSTNHLRLSEMADNKANIMITVNSIIISVLLTVLFRKLENDPRFLLPSILLLFTSLTTIVFAIIATRPIVTAGVFTKNDIHNKRANLLFFGNFYKMKQEDYEWGIQQMMNDSEFLYGSMTRDIYNLGVVLGRKYKMLRIAYNFFMFGFIISVLSFVLVVLPFNVLPKQFYNFTKINTVKAK
jgi:predicted metal-dependent HD superfamily phosphohydrolase